MPRPDFSTKTRLVFARLDREIPFDRKAIEEMKKHKVIISVRDNAFLRKKFQEAGKRHTDIFAIPFRRPGEAGNDFHGRSLSAKAAEGKHYVFKGSGAPGKTSFQFARDEKVAERQFRGGARQETIAQAVDVLSQLEWGFKKAKLGKDAHGMARCHAKKNLPFSAKKLTK